LELLLPWSTCVPFMFHWAFSWYSVLRTFILFRVCLTGSYYLFKWWSVITNLVIAKNSCRVLLYVGYSAGGINWWHYWGQSQPWMPSLWYCVTQKAGPGALGGASVWLLIYSIYSFRQHFFRIVLGCLISNFSIAEAMS
jgi:hypothetical protein